MNKTVAHNFFRISLTGKQISFFRSYSSSKIHLRSPSEWSGIKYDPNTPMWKEQSKVPRLPVPTLKETLDRYIDIVAPFTPTEQLNATKKIVNEFYEGEESKKLQQDLLHLDKESPTSYLEGFWDTMYLELRDPVIINVNPYVILKDDPQRKTQESRAANVVTGALKFLQKIRSNTAEPDLDKDGPLDMSQYLRVFGTARIPQWRRDYIITDNNSRHITIMFKNHFFTLEVIKNDGTLLSEEEMQSYFKYITKQNKNGTENAISIFTAEERNRWAAIRSELIVDAVNKNSIDKIDKSLLVLVLDDFAPSNALESSEAMLHNRDGLNRWFDKLNIVVFANSQTGVVFEHSPIDGHTVLRTVSEAVSHAKAPVVSPSNLQSTSALSQLKWNLSDSIKNSIQVSKKNVASLISSLQTSPLIFSKYGKNYITSKKLSPDAYVQMAFQLAYYKLYKRIDSTYESASTKKFVSGRTETLRSVTQESAAFVKTWTNSSASNSQKIESLKNATEAHIKRANFVKNGFGVDRHLFALRNLAIQKQQRLPRYTIPSLFSDPTYYAMCSNILSTSNVSSPIFDLFGFGPVISNGLGLAYNIHNDSLRFNVTSFIGEAKKYTDKLEESLNEMKSILDA